MIASDQSPVLAKTIELCQTILDQPEFLEIRRKLDAFQDSPAVQEQYQDLSERGSELQHKQRMGLELADEEIREFEKRRDAFLGNDVARGFLDAQQTVHEVRETVSKYVSRTFELGRMPQPDDFHSCGHGCNCG